MLDLNVIAVLIANLGDSESAAQALVELAKHGAHSDAGAMQTLISNQMICVAPCWIPMLLPPSLPT
jgi:hypothetical protein